MMSLYLKKPKRSINLQIIRKLINRLINKTNQSMVLTYTRKLSGKYCGVKKASFTIVTNKIMGIKKDKKK